MERLYGIGAFANTMTKQSQTEKKENRVLRQLKKLPSIWHAVSSFVSPFVWVVPPLVVLCSMLLYFHANAYYPYGEITVSWCDMDQQFVPLLLDLKDILAGKEGLFLNFKNRSLPKYFEAHLLPYFSLCTSVYNL